jgi:predicted XRE-type DNA-binding protein
MAKRKKTRPEDIEYEYGSGNVFADFGLSRPEQRDVKADLAILIRNRIKSMKLTQKQAAERMGIDQPKISKITRGILSDFTIDRLMSYLVALGYKIEISPILVKKEHPFIYVSRKSLSKRAIA